MSNPFELSGSTFPYRDMTAAEVRIFAEEVGRRAAVCWRHREAVRKQGGDESTAYGFKLEAGTHEEDLWILKDVLEGWDAARFAAR